MSAGASDQVNKVPPRNDSKCDQYAAAMNSDTAWLDYFGPDLPYHFKKFIQTLMKIPGKTMWPRFNDGSVGARLGGYLGGMIAGCSPFKDGIGHLIDVFDAADSPRGAGTITSRSRSPLALQVSARRRLMTR